MPLPIAWAKIVSSFYVLQTMEGRQRPPGEEGGFSRRYKQFGRKVLSLVPEFDGEIKGMEMIKLMAESMFEEVLE